MSDLRKAAEMALEALEQTPTVNKLFDSESYEKQKDAIDALRQALAQPEQESFIVDRGCWEHGCMAHDERDGDGVIIEAKLKEKNT